MTKKISYDVVGDNYQTKDPTKKLALKAAASTARHLKRLHFQEVAQSRGESAFVWQQAGTYMASVIEGLGTKNLVADAMRAVTGKTYYDVIGHDTVATVINDLVSVGARPLVLHAYWAVEDNAWLEDRKRMNDFIKGWKEACDLAQVTWGGGESPTLKGIISPGTIELGGSAVGVIGDKRRLISEEKLRVGDTILLLKSSGINANGVSLARAVAKKLPKGYGEKLESGTIYGEAILTKTNIYARLVADLIDQGVDVHYLSNITGHGLRKIMRARKRLTYRINTIAKPPEVFHFIQHVARLSNREMYQTFNMGMDYAIFLPSRAVSTAQKLIRKHGFQSIIAGTVESGKKQVIIEPLSILFEKDELNLKA